MELDNDATIQAFESSRFVKYHAQYLRNRNYWRELLRLQKESFDDSRLLLGYLRKKAHNARALASAWKTYCLREKQDMQDLKKSRVNLSFHNIGEAACQMISDTEESAQRQLEELVNRIEVEVIPQALDKLESFEKSVELLGEKGKSCLFALMFIENRVSHYYSMILQTPARRCDESSRNDLTSPFLRDRFLLVSRYYSAVQRQRRLIEKCNQHFRQFFQMAKDLETHRMTMVTRIADAYLTKVAEFIQKMALGNKTTIDSLKGLPQHMLASQRGFAEELDRRVRDLFPQENGEFERLASIKLSERQQLQRFRSGSTSLLSSLSGVPSPDEPPTIDDWLKNSRTSLHRIFVCYQEEVGYVLSSWNLVLAIVTTAGFLHLMKYPGRGENLQLPVSQIFSKSIDETKLCFEDDICSGKFISSSSINSVVSSAGDVANKSVTGQQSRANSSSTTASSADSSNSSLASNHGQHWVNDTWRQFMQSVRVEDLERGCDEESWARIIEEDFSRNNGSGSHDVKEKEDFVHVLNSYDLRQCAVTLRPSAIPSENIIEIVESVVDNTSFFVFSRTTERILTLKTRIQQDAIQMVSLIQAARTSPNLMSTVTESGSLKSVSRDSSTVSPRTNEQIPSVATENSDENRS